MNELSRLRDIKERGLDTIQDSTLRANVEILLSELGKVGLFLVPVGELESWIPKIMKGHSRENKSQWAMLAAEKIEDVGERNKDVWSFIRTVYDFLNRGLEQLAKG